jgi:hypothetical protein
LAGTRTRTGSQPSRRGLRAADSAQLETARVRRARPAPRQPARRCTVRWSGSGPVPPTRRAHWHGPGWARGRLRPLVTPTLAQLLPGGRSEGPPGPALLQGPGPGTRKSTGAAVAPRTPVSTLFALLIALRGGFAAGVLADRWRRRRPARAAVFSGTAGSLWCLEVSSPP